jgi:hypothetical protein
VTTAVYHVGHVLDVLATMPDASFDFAMFSPPFLALRDYLPHDHPDKAKEIGAELTPGDYIDSLLDVVEALRPKMTRYGSIAVELGDTYSGSGGGGGDYLPGGMREGQPGFAGAAMAGRKTRRTESGSPVRDDTPRGRRTGRSVEAGWPMDKSLAMIPELFRVALAYGFNPLTGRQTPRWRVRNVVRWARPNPPVGDLGDKFRPAVSDMVVICTDSKRWFDLDAVRTTSTEPGTVKHRLRDHSAANPRSGWAHDKEWITQNPAGAPPYDWWEPLEEERALWDAWADALWVIPPRRFKGAHYAVMPPALCVRPIESMCPLQVCVVCGEPRRRLHSDNDAYEGRAGGPTHNNAVQGASLKGIPHKVSAPPRWLPRGWSECGCGEGCVPTTWKKLTVDAPVLDDDGEPTGQVKRRRRTVVDQVGECRDPAHWRPGVVLDPFAGTGTTLAVAVGHGRSAIGIDLDERNADLARMREGLGMFLEVVEHRPPAAVDVAVGEALA